MGSKQYSNIKQHSEKIGQVLLSSFSRGKTGRCDFKAEDFFPGGFMLGIMCPRAAWEIPPSWMLWPQPQPCTWSLLTSMELLLGALPCQLQHSPVLLPFQIMNEMLSISTPKPVVLSHCSPSPWSPAVCLWADVTTHLQLPEAKGEHHPPLCPQLTQWPQTCPRVSYCAPDFPKPFVTGLMWSLCLRHCLATLQRSHRLLLRALGWCCWSKQVTITRRREKREAGLGAALCLLK